jgi:hypothetical protein
VALRNHLPTVVHLFDYSRYKKKFTVQSCNANCEIELLVPKTVVVPPEYSTSQPGPSELITMLFINDIVRSFGNLFFFLLAIIK